MRELLIAGLFALLGPGLALAKPPVVVELYTAQGCVSCIEANAKLAPLAARPDVLALTFSVDYWDYLGWPDTFARPDFTARQKAYVTRLALREPYTPQVVVNGSAQVGGLQTDKIEALITKAEASGRRAPAISFSGQRRVYVGSGLRARAGADVWLVRYDPKEQDVDVRKGDNRGQTVTHVNVVREVTRLGSWRGKPVTFKIAEAPEDGLAVAVLVQGAKGGRILGAARLAPVQAKAGPANP